MSLSDEMCIYEEVYGFLMELEEAILNQKTDNDNWFGFSNEEIAKNNLWALAFLSSLDRPLEDSQKNQLRAWTQTAKSKSSSEREYLNAYVLGLFLCYESKLMTSEEISALLVELVERSEQQLARANWDYSIEYLFNISLFFDALSTTVSPEVFEEAKPRTVTAANRLADNFEILRTAETKAKTLHVLSALSLKNRLNDLYASNKTDIETLRDVIWQHEIRILLLKPYMDLQINCHRKLVFDLKDSLRKNEFDIEMKHISSELSRAFLFESQSDGPGVRIEQKSSSSGTVSIDLSTKEIEALRTKRASIPFISTVGLVLCASGFKRTYTVPNSELSEYESFKKSKQTERFNQVNKQGMEEIVETSVARAYYFMLLKGLLFLTAALVIISLSAVIPSSYKGYSAAGGIVIAVALQLIALIPSAASSGIGLIITLINGKKIINSLRKGALDKLGM